MWVILDVLCCLVGVLAKSCVVLSKYSLHSMVVFGQGISMCRR